MIKLNNSYLFSPANSPGCLSNGRDESDNGRYKLTRYLTERKRKQDLRSRVTNRFDKIIEQAVASGNKRIKGMSIAQAVRNGTDIIKEADYMFLLELKNIRSSSFLSVLFDTVN